MSQSLSKIYVHSIFSTKFRLNSIIKKDLSNVHRYMSGIINNLGAASIEVGGIENHIHILSTLPKNLTASILMGIVKSNTSRWIKKTDPYYQDFAWQRGYAIFSVSSSHLDRVQRYIQNQEEHHRKMNFKSELTDLLEYYKVDYDEKYLWR